MKTDLKKGYDKWHGFRVNGIKYYKIIKGIFTNKNNIQANN